MSSRENKWQGRNSVRWKNDDTTRPAAAEAELDPVKRAALFIRMNDLVCMDNVIIPVVYRPRVAAVSTCMRRCPAGITTSGTGLVPRRRYLRYCARRRHSARALIHQLLGR